ARINWNDGVPHRFAERLGLVEDHFQAGDAHGVRDHDSDAREDGPELLLVRTRERDAILPFAFGLRGYLTKLGPRGRRFMDSLMAERQVEKRACCGSVEVVARPELLAGLLQLAVVHQFSRLDEELLGDPTLTLRIRRRRRREGTDDEECREPSGY